MARADARHVTDLDEDEAEAGFSVAMGRAARRASDAFAGAVALGLAIGVIANIFFLQDASHHPAPHGVTTVSVEPKKAAPVAGPGTPAMIFAPAAPLASAPPAAPQIAPTPVAPRVAAPAPVAVEPAQEALVPPAALPVPKTPSPVVADIQRELARRGFYDGAIDGLTGPKTEGAVRAFEQAARLKVGTGEPNEAVLAELRRSPAAAVAAAPPPAPVVAAAPRPLAPAPVATPQPVQTAGARPMLPPAAVPGDAGVTGSVRPPGDVGNSNRILAVQKSLARLGYGPIRIDGQPGADTRQAILRFERDRNLPATGEINDRLIRELSAVSGAPVM